MDKNEVRQLIMNRRHELSDEDIEMQSGLIIDRLKKSDIYKTSENVFLYMSYKDVYKRQIGIEGNSSASDIDDDICQKLVRHMKSCLLYTS